MTLKLTAGAAAAITAGYGAHITHWNFTQIALPKPEIVYDPAKNAEACAKQMTEDQRLATAIKAHNRAVQYRARKRKAAAASAAAMDASAVQDVEAAQAIIDAYQPRGEV